MGRYTIIFLILWVALWVIYVNNKRLPEPDTTSELTIKMGNEGDFAMGYNPGPDLYVSNELEVVGGERFPDAVCSVCGLKESDEIEAEREEHKDEDLYVSGRMWTEYKDKTYCGDCWIIKGEEIINANY